MPSMRETAMNRRTLLGMLAASGGALGVACRSRDNADQRPLIRQWFKAQHNVDLSDEAVDEVREYLRQSAAPAPDPALQPGTLFDAEVDLG
jgi:hypothetical protein